MGRLSRGNERKWGFRLTNKRDDKLSANLTAKVVELYCSSARGMEVSEAGGLCSGILIKRVITEEG